MSSIRCRIKQIVRLGLMLITVITLSTCAGSARSGGTSWKEEVLLHDGSKIIVERSVERGGRHEVGQKPPYSEQSLSFVMPGTRQTIQWEDRYSKDIGTANFLPMLLDISEGAAYLVASPMGCLSYNKWGRPNPPYVVFKHSGKSWQRVPLKELPETIKTPNLIFSMPDIEVERSGARFMSAAMIKAIRAGYRRSEFRTILREPVKGGITSCEELVHYKCGWGAPGEFNKEYFESICR